MKKLISIALVHMGHAGLDAQILQGLYDFSHPDQPWMFHDLSKSDTTAIQLSYLQTIKAKVIVGHINQSEDIKLLQATGIPLINLSDLIYPRPFPVLGVASEQLGAMAAEYFLVRGFQHFGFAGHSTWYASNKVMKAYCGHLTQRGFKVHVLPPDAQTSHGNYQQFLDQKQAWLRSLPKPIALYCDLDSLANVMCNAAQVANYKVPEDIAVLGTTNHSMICQLCHPPLSSIELPGVAMGHEMGKLIVRVLAGKTIPECTHLAPIGVVTRRSTDIQAVPDPILGRALALIHAHLSDGISIAQILKPLPISQCQLFRLFRKHIQHSPHQELIKQRCLAAKQMLATTTFNVDEIARRCGFRDNLHLGRMFKKQENMTPLAYRKMSRKPTK